ncbi:hypothetical protein AB0M31_01640 [Streptomyces sp. NPDC051773]
MLPDAVDVSHRGGLNQTEDELCAGGFVFILGDCTANRLWMTASYLF